MNYIYTGNELISESDIRHWKYINKKKINGKWRYYYDDSEFRSAKKEYNDARYLKEETAAAKAGEHFIKTRSKNRIALMDDAIIGTIAKVAAAIGNFFRRIRGL